MFLPRRPLTCYYISKFVNQHLCDGDVCAESTTRNSTRHQNAEPNQNAEPKFLYYNTIVSISSGAMKLISSQLVPTGRPIF